MRLVAFSFEPTQTLWGGTPFQILNMQIKKVAPEKILLRKGLETPLTSSEKYCHDQTRDAEVKFGSFSVRNIIIVVLLKGLYLTI